MLLSTGDDDVPGLAVKEWFETTSFAELDRQLRAIGPRSATIKSDIALHLPGLDRPIYFAGQTRGTIADTPPTFKPSIHHPWLTPTSFSGWFVPDGSQKRLGEMSFEESWSYDFRIQSLLRLVDALEEYSAALNLPPQSYTRPRTEAPTRQLSFLRVQSPVFVLVGRTCAGKTTFGQYASQHHALRFVEASSVVRMFRDEFPDASSPYDLAQRVLDRHGPDVVARRIIHLFSQDFERGLVITGFRTIEELETLRAAVPGGRIVLVQATDRTRFQRELARARPEAATTLQSFRDRDTAQWQFGLLRVAEDFATIRVENEAALEDYYRQIDAILSGQPLDHIPGISTDIRPGHRSERNQLYRCLHVLDQAGRPLTCDEIETLTSSQGGRIRHNNANKVLKRVPELARRLQLRGTRVRYEILNAGRAYIRFTLTHSSP